VRVPDLPGIEPLKAECQHFLECIETGRQPRAGGLAGLQVVQILEAAERSVALGSQPVELPSQGSVSPSLTTDLRSQAEGKGK
jgi:predicted dehydrogenase